MKRPNVFEFMDVCQFLQETYIYRKSSEQKFTYQRWAEEMGIKDRSYLRQVVFGKRNINSDMTEKICKNMKFTDLEGQSFRILNAYSAADDGAKRDELGKKLIHLLKQSDTVLLDAGA